MTTYLTAAQVAELLGVSRSQGDEILRRCVHVRLGPKTLRVEQSELRRLVSTMQVMPEVDARDLPPIEPWPRTAGVYFAACFGRVKIGVAKCVARRLTELQIACPMALELLAVAPGGPDDEAAFHARFDGHRVQGEWFMLAPPIVECIRSLRSG